MKRMTNLFGDSSKPPASSHVAGGGGGGGGESSSATNQSTQNQNQNSNSTSIDSNLVSNSKQTPFLLSANQQPNLNSMRSTSYSSASIHSNSHAHSHSPSNFNLSGYDSFNPNSNPLIPILPVAFPLAQPQPLTQPQPQSQSQPQALSFPSVTTPHAHPHDSNPMDSQSLYSIERTDLHKSLKSLESLLVSLDEYRDLNNRLAKVERRISKNSAELAKGKAVKEIPAQTLLASSALFESLTETSSKHSKYLQKEYESLNEACGKFFKKIAKEEKIQDETLETLDSKIKRAQQSHEKSTKSKSSGLKAVESHDKYMTQIGNLSNELNLKKREHSISTGLKNHSINLLIASTLGGLADSKFKRLCEEVRRSGSHIGKLNEWLNFCTMACNNPNESMPNGQPVYLDEDETGLATKLVQMQNLLYSQAQNNALKQAELFQKEQMREEGYMKAQEEELRQIELERKARELGWTPPNPNANSSSTSNDDSRSIKKSDPTNSEQLHQQQQQQPSVSFSNLPKLDSSGQELKPKEASSPGGLKSNNTSISTSTNATTPSNSNPNSILNNSVSNLDQVNHGSSGATSIETSAAEDSKSRSGSNSAHSPSPAPVPSNSQLNRNETLQSQKAEPQSWENEHFNNRTGSQSPSNSVHEGTVVDRGEDGNSETEMEFSSVGGGGGGAGGDKSITSSPNNHVKFIQKEIVGESKGILQNGPNSSSSSHSNEKAKNRQEKTESFSTLDRKPSRGPSPTPPPSIPKEVIQDSSLFNDTPKKDGLERKRTTSLWERERERTKVLDRERELTSKLNDFKSSSSESRDRSMGGMATAGLGEGDGDRRGYSRESTPRASVGYSIGDEIPSSTNKNVNPSGILDRPRPVRYSLDSSNRAGVGIGSFNKKDYDNGLTHGHSPNQANGAGYLYRQEISSPPPPPPTIPSSSSNVPLDDKIQENMIAPPDFRDSKDHYAPLVGRSKLNGGAVNRSLSTDTTASERSFVARMKAKYQVEKDRDRDRERERERERQRERERERELYEREREKEREARRLVGPPADAYPHHAYDYDKDRRVSTPPNLPPNSRRVSDLASQYNSSSERDRDRDSRSWALSPPSSSQTLPSNRDGRNRLPPPADEFGMYRHPSNGIAPRSPRSNQGQMDRNGLEANNDEVPHSSVCGCARCSAAKYAASPSSGRNSPNPERAPASYNQGYSSVKSKHATSQPPPASSSSLSSRFNPPYNGSGFSSHSSNSQKSYDPRFDYPSNEASYSNNPNRRDFISPPPVVNQREREANVRRQSLPPPKPNLEPPAPTSPGREYGTFVRGYGGDKVGDRLMEEKNYANNARRSFERN